MEDELESIEDSLAAAFSEGDSESSGEPEIAQEPEVLSDSPSEGREEPQDDEPELKIEKPKKMSLSEAARQLASAKKKGKKQVVEKEELDVPTKPEVPAAEPPKAAVQYQPPEEWDVQSKEAFLALPEVGQKQIREFWNGIKGHSTKLWQDLNREKNQHAEVNQVVNEYLPRWDIAGLTPGKAIRELCAFQDLSLRDPDYAVAWLISKSKANLEKVNAYLAGQQPAPQNNIPQNPNHSWTEESIQERINRGIEERLQREALGKEQAELSSLKHEVENGQYLWPELHDDQAIERLKPLVDAVKKTKPGLSWIEATREGIKTLRFLEGRYQSSPSLHQPRLSRDQEIQRAKAASVSLRGRGNASIPVAATAKPDESLSESLEAVFYGSRNGY